MQQRGFAHILILLLILILLALAAGFYLSRKQDNNISKPQYVKVGTVQAASDNKEVEGAVSKNSLNSDWKTYTNSKYNFQLTYPAQGMILTKDGYQNGECGQVIKEGAAQSNRILRSFIKEVIKVDSFFEILVLAGPKTVDEYLIDIGAKTQYDLLNLTGSSADEAVEVVGLKKGSEYAVGYPPLAYISHIFRKGEYLFLIKHFFNPDNLGGCVEPALLDPVAHSHLKIKDWDLKTSLKFP